MFPNVLQSTALGGELIVVKDDCQFVVVTSEAINKVFINGIELPKSENREVRYGDLEGARIRINYPLWEVFMVDGEKRLYRSSISNDGIWQKGLRINIL